MMMTGQPLRGARGIRLVLLGALLLGSLIGLTSRPGAIAQEIQATPLTDETSTFGTASSELTLTINSGPVDFGTLWTGETPQIESAAVIVIGGTAGGPWQLSCSAIPTAAHTTDLPVTALEYAQSGTSDWAPFQSSPAPCVSTMDGDRFVRFDYRVQVPRAATPGAFNVLVTYSVAAIE